MIQMVLKLSLILGISLLSNISFSSETFQSPELLIQNISQPLAQLSQNQKIRNDSVALQKNLEKLFEPHFAKSSLLKHIFGAPWVSNNYSLVQESGDVFFKVMITELAQVLSQYDRWKISFNSLDDKQQHSQYRFAEKLLSSDTDAVATLDFVSENHAPNHFYMRLNIENGDWKISDFAHNNQSLVDLIRSNNISKLSEDSLIQQFVSQKKSFYANQSETPSSGKKSKNKKGKVNQEQELPPVNPLEVNNDEQYHSIVALLFKSLDGLREFSKCNFIVERPDPANPNKTLEDTFNIGEFDELGEFIGESKIKYNCTNGVDCLLTQETGPEWLSGSVSYTFKFRDHNNAKTLGIGVNNLIKYCKGSKNVPVLVPDNWDETRNLESIRILKRRESK